MLKTKTLRDRSILYPMSLFILMLVLLTSSCKSDTNAKDSLTEGFKAQKDFVNFYVNDAELEGQDRFGGDIIWTEYENLKRDKEHVHYVNVGDTVVFEDISTWVEGAPPAERNWLIGTDKQSETGVVFKYLPEIEGEEYITLKFSDQVKITKGIVITAKKDFENEEFASEEIPDESLASDDQPNFDEPERKVEPKRTAPERKAEPRKTTMPKKVTPARTPVRTSTPKPKAPAPIRLVDFNMNKTTIFAGESIIFTDMSQPSASVKQRVWDFGNGETINSSGNKSKKSFLRAGTYEIKLCLNYSSLCKTKTISVKPSKTPPPPPPVLDKPKKEEPKKEIKVSRVTISSASTGMVGKPIEISDDSYPKEAVKSRIWYVNGEKTNFTLKRFNKTFDKPGTYNIKLCVNGSSSDCGTKIITVADKPKPPKVEKAVEAASAGASAEDFYATEEDNSGLRASLRCADGEKKWSEGTTQITLTPKVMCQLMNARVYGKKVAKAKVVLKEVGGSLTRTMKNVQILPGGSTIEFGDLATVLMPNKTYTLTVQTMGADQVLLENGGACNTTSSSHKNLGIKYKDNNMTLFDIRFEY